MTVKYCCYADVDFQLTLRDLSGQRGGNGDKVQVFAAIVDGHLPALPKVIGVSVALSHEQIQRKAPVHEHPCRARARITTLVLVGQENKDKGLKTSRKKFSSFLPASLY